MSDEAKQIPFELPLRTSANPDASGIVYDAADLGVLSAEGFVGVADRQQARAEYAARAINVFAELGAMLEEVLPHLQSLIQLTGDATARRR